MAISLLAARRGMNLVDKLREVPWGMIALIVVIASYGLAILFSAAGGSLDPWASRQMIRLAVGLMLMLLVALIDLRFWFKVAYPIYALALLLLVGVEVAGEIGMGAQRWLDVGIVQLQPSELMKIGLVLVLARYFHGLTLEEVGHPLKLIWPTLLVMAPAALVVKQPDLGTAMLLVLMSGVMFLLAGVRLWKFAIVIAAGLGAIPIAWNFLRDYQKNRVLTFLNPESDPLGAGYHIIQSKIALGSGGVWGKGFLQGTQSRLQFLPERQTDFVFTMLSEELGIVGGLALIGLYAVVLLYGTAIALRSKSQFGRLVGMGVITTFFIYAFINISMVMGLVPVVGVPLPLVSYGGTALLSLLIGFGFVLNVNIHREVPIGRAGSDGI